MAILSHIDQGWSHESLAETFNHETNSPKAKGYNGRGKPWAVAGCFKAAEANFLAYLRDGSQVME